MVSLISPKQIGGATSPPSRTLAQRPTKSSHRKRSSDDEAYNFADTPARSKKRLKVTFGEEHGDKMSQPFEAPLDAIRQEVIFALDRHARGDDSLYDSVKQIYTEPMYIEDLPSTTTVHNHTTSLLAQVSRLNRSCSGLVGAVLESQWLGRDEAYVLLFSRFLGSLLSVHGTYTGEVLRMLVENLMHETPQSGHLTQYPTVLRSQRYNRIHSVLKYLLRLIPSASTILSNILASSFPDPSETKRVYTIYTHNILTITQYAPELHAEILALITERLVRVDVQVQDEYEELEEDLDDGLIQQIPQIDGKEASAQKTAIEELDDQSDESSDEEDEDELDDEELRARNVAKNIQKMDLLLDILFTHYTPHFSSDLPFEVHEDAFESLLSQFSTIILPTYRSRHTQFLLFHFAQTSPILVDRFIKACADTVLSDTRPSLIRQSAAAYLASFVARGMHVSKQDVRDIFVVIADLLTSLRRKYEPTCRGPDLRKYSIYYSLVQALLYIFCFRWRDLRIDDRDETDLAGSLGLSDDEDNDEDNDEDMHHHTWIPELKDAFRVNITSRLNPLKICAPVIVGEFARIAHHLNVFYAFTIIESNKRLHLGAIMAAEGFTTASAAAAGTGNHGEVLQSAARQTALSARKDDAWLQLDGYFPFDPYRLPKSRRWLEGDYREWRDVGVGGRGSSTRDVVDDENDGSSNDGSESEDSEDEED
ncbi:hypothetical protein MMC25_004571 [Agyrium rufum]|nr:hypothetical protein [Agyrium rufum]